MKTKDIITKTTLVLCLGLAAGLFAGCASDRDDDESEGQSDKQAKLMAEAKVSKEDAENTALAKVPNGTMKEWELEKEKGKLIWSFGFTTPDTKNITEVNVNAIDGSIVNVETETPEDEAKEGDKD
jgi:uncharacterized membrane protein YkoI